MPYYNNRDPKRDPNLDNHPQISECRCCPKEALGVLLGLEFSDLEEGLGFRIYDLGFRV